MIVYFDYFIKIIIPVEVTGVFINFRFFVKEKKNQTFSKQIFSYDTIVISAVFNDSLRLCFSC